MHFFLLLPALALAAPFSNGPDLEIETSIDHRSDTLNAPRVRHESFDQVNDASLDDSVAHKHRHNKYPNKEVIQNGRHCQHWNIRKKWLQRLYVPFCDEWVRDEISWETYILNGFPSMDDHHRSVFCLRKRIEVDGLYVTAVCDEFHIEKRSVDSEDPEDEVKDVDDDYDQDEGEDNVDGEGNKRYLPDLVHDNDPALPSVMINGIEKVEGKKQTCAQWKVSEPDANNYVEPVCINWVPSDQDTEWYPHPAWVSEGVCSRWVVEILENRVWPACVEGTRTLFGPRE